jgi:hypothetical protein
MNKAPACCGEVVSNFAGGKDFWYCRGCKKEVIENDDFQTGDYVFLIDRSSSWWRRFVKVTDVIFVMGEILVEVESDTGEKNTFNSNKVRKKLS